MALLSHTVITLIIINMITTNNNNNGTKLPCVWILQFMFQMFRCSNSINVDNNKQPILFLFTYFCHDQSP